MADFAVDSNLAQHGTEAHFDMDFILDQHSTGTPFLAVESILNPHIIRAHFTRTPVWIDIALSLYLFWTSLWIGTTSIAYSILNSSNWGFIILKALWTFWSGIALELTLLCTPLLINIALYLGPA